MQDIRPFDGGNVNITAEEDAIRCKLKQLATQQKTKFILPNRILELEKEVSFTDFCKVNDEITDFDDPKAVCSTKITNSTSRVHFTRRDKAIIAPSLTRPQCDSNLKTRGKRKRLDEGTESNKFNDPSGKRTRKKDTLDPIVPEKAPFLDQTSKDKHAMKQERNEVIVHVVDSQPGMQTIDTFFASKRKRVNGSESVGLTESVTITKKKLDDSEEKEGKENIAVKTNKKKKIRLTPVSSVGILLRGNQQTNLDVKGAEHEMSETEEEFETIYISATPVEETAELTYYPPSVPITTKDKRRRETSLLDKKPFGDQCSGTDARLVQVGAQRLDRDLSRTGPGNFLLVKHP